MRLLVTGAAGFIGSNFVRYWVQHHPEDEVVAYDVLTYAGNRPNLDDVEDRITFVQGDIGDLEFVSKTLAEHQTDVVVNFAAESHNSLAILDPAAFDKLTKLLRYVDGDYADIATFQELRKQMGDAKAPSFYLAIPPDMFGIVVEQLGKSGCSTNGRVIVEKPFGRDLASALALNKIFCNSQS